MTEEKNKAFLEGINTYYKLKAQYESTIKGQKTDILKREGLSWKEKRKEFIKLKHKCVNCKRPVGTKFSNMAEEDDRHLIAVCGDRVTPCPLNIDINIGLIFVITDYVKSDENDINKYKRHIIIGKNDLLFGYITPKQAVSNFDNIKEQMTKTMSGYEYTMKMYLDVVSNTEKRAEILKIQKELHVNIDSLKTMIAEYEKTQTTQYVHDAVELYVNDIVPKINEINKTSFHYCNVEYTEEEGTFHLVKKQFSVEDLEMNVGEHEKGVVSLRMGVDETIKRAKPATVHKPAIPALSGANKVKLVVKEPEEEDEDEEPRSEEEEK